MKLERAIELNNKVLSTFDYRLEETEKDAIKLGIEALKRHIQGRHGWSEGHFPALPGETK